MDAQDRLHGPRFRYRRGSDLIQHGLDGVDFGLCKESVGPGQRELGERGVVELAYLDQAAAGEDVDEHV